jgi:hypothetical protein
MANIGEVPRGWDTEAGCKPAVQQISNLRYVAAKARLRLSYLKVER